MLDIVITNFITLVKHIIPGFQCNNSTKHNYDFYDFCTVATISACNSVREQYIVLQYIAIGIAIVLY